MRKEPELAYVIGAACVDVTDRSCVEQCPVDCIYEGRRKLYINPVECIDCGACEATCPMEAIAHESRLPTSSIDWRQDTDSFFSAVLPGRVEPLGSPGSATEVGPVEADTTTVEAMPSVRQGDPDNNR